MFTSVERCEKLTKIKQEKFPTLETDKDILKTIDKKNFKPGEYVEGIITITDDEGNFVKFTFPSVLLPTPAKEVMGAFFETEGEIAMEAHSAYYVSKSENAHYELLAPYGRHGSGLKLYPNTLDPMTLGIENVPFVEYRFVYHIYPEDQKDLVQGNTKFNNLDFDFNDKGALIPMPYSGNKEYIIFQRQLPTYEYSRFIIGQFDRKDPNYKTYWSVEIKKQQ